jgi:hypothetical protein
MACATSKRPSTGARSESAFAADHEQLFDRDAGRRSAQRDPRCDRASPTPRPFDSAWCLGALASKWSQYGNAIFADARSFRRRGQPAGLDALINTARVNSRFISRTARRISRATAWRPSRTTINWLSWVGTRRISRTAWRISRTARRISRTARRISRTAWRISRTAWRISGTATRCISGTATRLPGRSAARLPRSTWFFRE